MLTDDQRAETLRTMPATLRWFKDGGTQFLRAFATTPVCCPSRASIMTGQYAHNHEVRTNELVDQFNEGETLHRYLQDQGYYTAMAGKYLNLWKAENDPAHFDRWALIEDDYDRIYYDFVVNETGEVTTNSEEYSTDYLARMSVDFLEHFEREDDDKPWYLYVAPYAPHQPATAEPRYAEARVDYYRGNPGVYEADRSDKPPFVQDKRVGGLSNARTVRSQQIRTLRSVDDLVARVARALKQLDEDRDTLAFFLSDNGYMWAEHHLTTKRWPYLPSIRIPLLMRWPSRVDAGGQSDDLVANIDVAATVLDALGVFPHEAYPVDGRSLLDGEGHERLLLENWFYKKGPPSWASTLTDEYHYIEYYEDDEETVQFAEYYDMRADPYETKNFIEDKDPANDPDLNQLQSQLARDRTCPVTQCP